MRRGDLCIGRPRLPAAGDGSTLGHYGDTDEGGRRDEGRVTLSLWASPVRRSAQIGDRREELTGKGSADEKPRDHLQRCLGVRDEQGDETGKDEAPANHEVRKW